MQHSNRQRYWKWTGFSEKTLFDWLDVVAVPAILALSAAGATYWISYQQILIGEDNRRSELMANYYERMQELLLKEKMLETPIGSQQRVMGSALTLSTFRQLGNDGERKGELLKFLYQAKLINGQCQVPLAPNQLQDCSIINLKGARLDKIAIEANVELSGVDLERARLAGANLVEIQLTKATMVAAELKRADLSKAVLNESQMKNAILDEAVLTDANLYEANLVGASLKEATLTGANLAKADLRCARLQGANLKVMKPGELEGTRFEGATYDELTQFPDEIDDNIKAQMREVPVGSQRKESCHAE
jgi:uncharacterized protein YjbI with pentapeptide repeats